MCQAFRCRRLTSRSRSSASRRTFPARWGWRLESVRIGELVMEALQRLDRVAYVRYASVYRNFQDAAEFRDAVDELDSRQEREKLALNQVELPLP